MLRALFVGEGSSDEGIVIHVERIAAECGAPLATTAPNMDLIPLSDKSVRGKLATLMAVSGVGYDLVLVHRDADREGRTPRLTEIESAVNAIAPGARWVPVIPVRMTESWLVVDEKLLRRVAGNPNGRMKLDIPSAKEAERVADPKELLRSLLVTAADLTGRRRNVFQARFPFHRRQLLEMLDPAGPVRNLESWLQFDRDLRNACGELTARPTHARSGKASNR